MRNNKNISKRVAELLTTATPRQKALLVTKDWVEKSILEQETLLTDDEVKAIRDSLQTDKEKEEYNKYVHIFNTYNELTPFLGLVFKEYQMRAEVVLGYIRVWEAYDQEENHLNTILQDLIDSVGEKAVTSFKNTMKNLSFNHAKIVITDDGYIEIDSSMLYELIVDSVKDLAYFYDAAKAIVIATEEYIKKTRSKAFVTEKILEAIDEIKSDYALNVAPKYSRKNLKDKIDKGIKVTKEEQKRAVYPYYEEVHPDEEFIQIMRDRIKQIEYYAQN